MKSTSNPVGLLALFLLAESLAGCGFVRFPLEPANTADSLKGNWLVTGAVPTMAPSVLAPTQLGVTMTIDVIDGEVVADVSEIYPCSGSADVGVGTLPWATLAVDGSFSLQTPQTGGLGITASIDGKTPPTVGEDWSGTYSATNSNPGCAPFAGTFTAVPIATVSGTFAGPAVFAAPNSAVRQAATLSMTLKQGGPASLDSSAASTGINSVNALSGTIAIQGQSCFSSGTASLGSASVAGDTFFLEFMMNDGSELLLTGSLADPTGSAILLDFTRVAGGACNDWSTPGGGRLTRQ
jgi:hypothetical protein